MTSSFTPKGLLKIYLVAGEPSGDLLGAHLMRAIRAATPRPIRFYGVGGPRMEAEGLNSLFPYYELSLMGFIEILPYIFNLAARMRQTVEDARTKQPDILITIDSPGFCFRLVKQLRAHELKTKFLHYVAPTVWAYKPQRAEKCAALFDHLLVLLPFEPPYFEKAGLACTFIGHPVVAETPKGDGGQFRQKYNLAADTPLLCLLPGSRKGEVERHMPLFAQVITLLARQFPNLALAVAVPHHVMPYVAPFFKNCPFRAVVMSNDEDKRGAMAAANLAIVKSGTVALEVAMNGAPMLVTYRVNALSARILRRMILTRYVNLINILANKDVIPELLQEMCTPTMIANAGAHLLAYPAAVARQKTEAAAQLAKLLPPAGQLPSELAAQVVLQLVEPS